MKKTEGGFEFLEEGEGWAVVYKRRRLGMIVGMKESSGRHCFRLGVDERKEPRTYRGKVKAAEALLSLDNLQREAQKKNWNTETLILHSWDSRPTVSETNNP